MPGPNSLWYVAFFGYKGQVSIYLFFYKKIYLTLGADHSIEWIFHPGQSSVFGQG